MILATTHGPSVLWYLTRGAGAMVLVLLTASVVLGVGEARLWRPAGMSRYAVAATHRTLSLLALVLLALHVGTVLLDPFPRIGILTAAVPFLSSYRPLWLGLGTLASDLLLAVVITSLLRRRLGYRAWRGTHWAAYACWPVAVLHGLGTGSDVKSGWMLALSVACVATVLVTVGLRLLAPGTRPGVRTGGAVALAAFAAGLVAWLPGGPLGHGWARRSGTPASVLAAFSPPPPAVPVAARRAARAVPRPRPVDALGRPFTASAAGQIRTGTSAGGTAVADLTMRLDQPRGVLRVRLGGQALEGGGLQMQRSAVTLGPVGDPGRYQGRVEALQGSRLEALVGTPDGRAVRLSVDLALGENTVTGQVSGTPEVRR